MRPDPRVALAVAGAIGVGAGAVLPALPGGDPAGGVEYCYGIARDGQNQCGHAYGAHACAGQAPQPFDGGNWTLVARGTCLALGGALEPFQGRNPARAAAPALAVAAGDTVER